MPNGNVLEQVDSSKLGKINGNVTNVATKQFEKNINLAIVLLIV